MAWTATLALVLTVGLGCRRDPAEVLVSAAASLRVPLEEIAREYSNAGRGRIVLNTASSSSLARQIREGAPVDLFVSADTAQMAAVEGAGRIVEATLVDLLANQLAVIAPTHADVTVNSLEDLTAPGVARIGMGDPSAVPVGVYARRLLAARGLWDRLQPKVVPGRSVEMTLVATEAGHVDAAFVYLTDARRSTRVQTLLVVAPDDGPRIVYPAAVVRGGNEAGARRFLDHLQTAAGRAVFTRLGFVEP